MKLHPNINTIQLKETSPLIKHLFKPGSQVKAFVKKISGENVVISVSNNTFKVKSEVNLEEGTWIKGKVFLDKNGTVNLKLIETFTPSEQLKLNAENFVDKHSLNKLPNAKELTMSLLENNIVPTKELVTKLAPLVENLNQTQLNSITWLLSQGLEINQQNINGAQSYLEANSSLPLLLKPPGDNMILNMLTLDLPKDGKTALKEVFDLFVKGKNASDLLEKFLLSTDKNNRQTIELMNIFNLFQKLNLKSLNQNAPFYWGIFFLSLSGNLKPVEFFLVKRNMKHDKNCKNKGAATAYNFGLYLTMPKLGAIVVRFFYWSSVLSIKFTTDKAITYNLIKSRLGNLKKAESFRKMQLSKIDIEQSELNPESKARKLLSTPFNPFGNLDIKA